MASNELDRCKSGGAIIRLKVAKMLRNFWGPT